MPYDVMRVDDGYVRATYETGAEAAETCRCLNDAHRESGEDTRFRVVKREDETPKPQEWHERERTRFEQGTYKLVPWAYEPWHIASKLNHFPHVANGNPEMIAFTPDDAFGNRDAQRRMRVGRYLEAYYGDVLDADQRRYWCGRWDIENEVGLAVQFADKPEDIVRVYTNGPTSCMSYPLSEYESNVHPTYVYGAGDLAVAYLEREGSVTARAICWPEKLIYGRIYGDSSRLTDMLHALGYKSEYTHFTSSAGSRGFRDARLLRIEHDNGFVMPWLDVVGSFRDDGEFLRLYGDLDGQSTTGVSEINGRTCDLCAERYNPEDEGGCVDGRELCDNCYSETSYCERCEERHLSENRYSTELNAEYCDECYEHLHSDCTQCDHEHANEHMTADVNGDLWCGDCAEDATRNNYGEIDPDFEPEDNEGDVHMPSETVHDPMQQELPL